MPHLSATTDRMDHFSSFSLRKLHPSTLAHPAKFRLPIGSSIGFRLWSTLPTDGWHQLRIVSSSANNVSTVSRGWRASCLAAELAGTKFCPCSRKTQTV